LQLIKQKRPLRKDIPAAVAVQPTKKPYRAKKKLLLRVKGETLQHDTLNMPIAVQKPAAKNHPPRIAEQASQLPFKTEDSVHTQMDNFKHILPPKNPQVEELIDHLLQKRAEDDRKAGNNPAFQASDECLAGDDLISDEPDRTRQLAQNYNLGVGEVELALKLSTIQYRSHREKDTRQQILNLKDKNLSIDEIARQAKLGKGEVELFLKFAGTSKASPKLKANSG